MHSPFEKIFAVGKYLPHVYGTSWCGFIHGLRKGEYTIEPRGICNLTFHFEICHFAIQTHGLMYFEHNRSYQFDLNKKIMYLQYKEAFYATSEFLSMEHATWKTGGLESSCFEMPHFKQEC